MVTPLFFGNSFQRQIYGAYHSPQRPIFRDSAVLFCCPIAQEYMRSHWMLRRLADQLAGVGFHVLRFDYSGTGDSAGEFCDADIGQWCEDVREAGEELLSISGASQLSVVGLRFGATLAALTAGLPVKDLILWDPVIDGAHYLNQLRVIHSERLKNRHRYPIPRVQGVDFDEREILGFWFSEKLEDKIGQIDLLTHSFPAVKKVVVLSSVESSEYASLQQHLLSDGVSALLEWVDEPCEWSSAEGISSALLGQQMSNKIAQRLVGND